MQNPCKGCPIHLRGEDKSGPACMACEARVAYVAAIGSGRTDVVLPPPVAAPPPPSPTFARKNYSVGPYGRRSRAGRKPGRPTGARTVMAARRVAKGLSQALLAEAAGVGVRTIAQLESGLYRYTPAPRTLRALSVALDIPAEMLLMPTTPARRVAP
jgi:DNA-binding XRE family transcriptional regulator